MAKKTKQSSPRFKTAKSRGTRRQSQEGRNRPWGDTGRHPVQRFVWVLIQELRELLVPCLRRPCESGWVDTERQVDAQTTGLSSRRRSRSSEKTKAFQALGTGGMHTTSLRERVQNARAKSRERRLTSPHGQLSCASANSTPERRASSAWHPGSSTSALNTEPTARSSATLSSIANQRPTCCREPPPKTRRARRFHRLRVPAQVQ